jgi:phytanoyl-CoA hydroxylase
MIFLTTLVSVVYIIVIIQINNYNYRGFKISRDTKQMSVIRSEPLSGEEILEFSRNGFLLPGQIFPQDTIEKMRSSLTAAQASEHEVGREYDLLDPAAWPTKDKEQQPQPGKNVGFLFNLWLWNKEWREFCFNPTLAHWASQLIGVRQVRLLEDNALYKAPKTGGTLKWHQDHPYWPLAQANAVTAWVALDDVYLENGAMQMAVGSHLLGERLPAVFGTGTPYLQEMRPSTVKPMEDPTEQGLDIQTIELKAGEVSIHHALTWHASGPNETDQPRRACIARYVGDGTIWLGSRRYEYNYSDKEVGIKIGQPIEGRYFPLIPFKSMTETHK